VTLRYKKGDVVVLPFPYTDMTALKTRPVLVIAHPRGTNLIVAQITSQQARNDEYSVSLEEKDFAEGSLPTASFVKTNMIMTLAEDMILAKTGVVNRDKIKEVEKRLIHIFKQ
jgi:mRNA interferase MazF